MKILMLTYEFPSCIEDAAVSGEVKNPYTLARGLATRGHSIEIVNSPFLTRNVRTVSSRPGAEFRITDVPEGRTKAAIRYLDRVDRVRRHLKTLDLGSFDVIHAQAPALALAASLAMRGVRRTGLVVTGHGTNLPEADADAHASLRQRARAINARLVLPIDRAGFRRADRAVAVSRFQVTEMCSLYGIDRERVVEIHNGIEIERYSLGRKHSSVEPRLLFVGRLAPKKGLLNLLHAFAAIRRQMPDATLHVVAGSKIFDTMGDDAKALIRTLQLTTSVEWSDAVPESEMPNVYARADLLIAPSEGYESLPTVILEAMAAGVPVVATRSWGTPEALGEDHPGLLNETTPTEIERVVGGLLRSPADLRRCVTQQNQRLPKFDSSVYVSKHVAMYEEVAAC